MIVLKHNMISFFVLFHFSFGATTWKLSETAVSFDITSSDKFFDLIYK